MNNFDVATLLIIIDVMAWLIVVLGGLCALLLIVTGAIYLAKVSVEDGAVYKYAFDGVHGGGLEDEDFSTIINAIDSAPPVDAVEVVRCKDCKHNEITVKGDFICPYYDDRVVPGDHFCSLGERREGKDG